MHMKNITPKYFQKNENIKTKNYIDKELKSESDTNSDSDSDSGTNNEEQIQKNVNLIIITKKNFKKNFFNTIKPNSIR